MPSGYTHDIYEGNPITFGQFALKCARGMGAAIHQRDDSLDIEISELTLDDYYLANVGQAGLALAEAAGRSSAEWEAMQDAEIARAEEYAHEYVTKRAQLRERYEGMLAAVDAWTPPTEEHEGLKQFMVAQLSQSIQFDCGGSYMPNVPKALPIAEYRDTKIAALSEAHARAVKRLTEQRERVRSQNAWVRALRDSLADQEGRTQ